MSRFTVLFALCALFHFLFCGVALMVAPVETLIAYLPDDAFYYLGLAREHARSGIWSFDGGVSRATGFHLLWGYLLSGVYGFFAPPDEGFVRLGILLSFGIAALCASLTLVWLFRRGREELLLLTTILLFSPNVLFNAVSVTEWSVTVALAVALVAAARGIERPPSPGRIALAVVCGLFGSLARSDFGLLPALLLFESFFSARRLDDRRVAYPALAAFAGAAAGVGLVLLHANAVSGNWVQASALVKSHWAAFVPFGERLYNAAMLLPSLFGFSLSKRGLWWDLAALGLIVVLTAAALKRAPRDEWRQEAPASPPWRAMALLLALYILFYAGNAALQPWYTVHLVVPAAIVARPLIASLRRRAPVLTGAIFLVIAAHHLLLIHPLDGNSGKWPHQRAMLDAGRYLKEHPLNGRVGAWNAGIIGYFAGGTVVNLDGLVNDAVIPFVRAGRLEEYLEKQGIRYIVDFDIMLSDPVKLKRGGYDGARFLPELTPLRRFDHGEYSARWRNLTLYRIGR